MTGPLQRKSASLCARGHNELLLSTGRIDFALLTGVEGREKPRGYDAHAAAPKRVSDAA